VAIYKVGALLSLMFFLPHYVVQNESNEIEFESETLNNYAGAYFRAHHTIESAGTGGRRNVVFIIRQAHSSGCTHPLPQDIFIMK